MTAQRFRTPHATKPALWASLGVVIACALVAGSSGGRATSSATRLERVSGGPRGTYVVPAGIHKIKHVIVIQQENRSFDSYFGTYPRRRRDPDEARQADGLRDRPATGAVSRRTSTMPT